jgi:hypothetical protein
MLRTISLCILPAARTAHATVQPDDDAALRRLSLTLVPTAQGHNYETGSPSQTEFSNLKSKRKSPPWASRHFARIAGHHLDCARESIGRRPLSWQDNGTSNHANREPPKDVMTGLDLQRRQSQYSRAVPPRRYFPTITKL